MQFRCPSGRRGLEYARCSKILPTSLYSLCCAALQRTGSYFPHKIYPMNFENYAPANVPLAFVNRFVEVQSSFTLELFLFFIGKMVSATIEERIIVKFQVKFDLQPGNPTLSKTNNNIEKLIIHSKPPVYTLKLSKIESRPEEADRRKLSVEMKIILQ